VGGSITCSDILCLGTQNNVRCSKLQFFYSKLHLYFSVSVNLKSAFIWLLLKCKCNVMCLSFCCLQSFLQSVIFRKISDRCRKTVEEFGIIVYETTYRLIKMSLCTS
jgi:hypothetical protein